jgi:hypothetical protein
VPRAGQPKRRDSHDFVKRYSKHYT